MSKWAPGRHSAPAAEPLPAPDASSLPWRAFSSINLWSRHCFLSLLLVQSREDASPFGCPGQENAPACDCSAAFSQHFLKSSSPPDPSPELPHEHPSPAVLPHPHSLWLGTVLRTCTPNQAQREVGTACSTALPLPLHWPHWHQSLFPPSHPIPAAQPAPGMRLSLPWSPADSRSWAWPFCTFPSHFTWGNQDHKGLLPAEACPTPHGKGRNGSLILPKKPQGK